MSTGVSRYVVASLQGHIHVSRKGTQSRKKRHIGDEYLVIELVL